MSVHDMPVQDRIEWLFDLARRHAAEFGSPEVYLSRSRYLAEHPTAVVVLKCMDGRINFSVATRTPPGIIQPFRNLGGRFDLGWPHLGEVLSSCVHRVVSGGRRVLLLITYHFSRSDQLLGCAGFDYRTDEALAHTRVVKGQAEMIFGRGHGTVYPVVCGFETDDDALILHDGEGGSLDLSTLGRDDGHRLPGLLASRYPDMPAQMQNDLLPLLQGNLARIDEVRRSPRRLDVEHREWTICLGRGFDFLHTPNHALIVGPYSPDLSDPIRKAAMIIEGNMKAGRIPDDGFLLLASVPYEEIGADRARAELKSRFLSGFAAGVIGQHSPDLAGRMFKRTAVLDWRSQALEILEG